MNGSTPKISLGLNNRAEILKFSLIMENLTSHFIAGLLDIEDVENSRTLGNKGSVLSFNQKIDLLIDLGALDTDLRAKFLAFMEIRNQFMHNAEASTYEKLFKYLEGKEKYIFKHYPQPQTLSREQALHDACLSLSKEVLRSTVKLIDNLKAKFNDNANEKVIHQSHEAFKKAIPEFGKQLNEVMEKKMSSGKPIQYEEFKDLGTIASQMIYSLWLKYFKQTQPEDSEHISTPTKDTIEKSEGETVLNSTQEQTENKETKL